MNNQNNILIYPAIVVAIMLFVAIFSWSYDYYILLRWIVTLVAIYYMYSLYSLNKMNGWMILLAIVAILFNPIIPVYLNDKSIWNYIDVITGVLLLIFPFAVNKTKGYE